MKYLKKYEIFEKLSEDDWLDIIEPGNTSDDPPKDFLTDIDIEVDGGTGLFVSAMEGFYDKFYILVKAGADLEEFFRHPDAKDLVFDKDIYDPDYYSYQWEKEDFQEFILTQQPNIANLLQQNVKIHPNIREKYKDLFDSGELGLL